MNTKTTWKNTLVRAARTFLQAAVACIVAGVSGLINSGESITKTALGALCVSAIAAGLAALMNLPASGASFDSLGGTEAVRRAVESINELPPEGLVPTAEQDEPEDGDSPRVSSAHNEDGGAGTGPSGGAVTGAAADWWIRLASRTDRDFVSPCNEALMRANECGALSGQTRSTAETSAKEGQDNG